MKKIISLVIALMMLHTTALANTVDGFIEAWGTFAQLKSYTGQTTMSVEVNEPLLFLEDIPLDDEAMDYPLMINDLLGSTATADYSVSISEDYKKIQMAMSMAYDVPVTFNEDLKLDAWARIGIWLDYDMTDPEAPVYKMIVKTPMDSKYQVMDVSQDVGTDMAEMLTPEVVSALSDGMVKIIEDNGEITKIRNGYRVKFDNAGMFGYMADIMKVSETLAGDDEMFAEMISAMEWAKDNLVLLGEDGMTLEFTKNARGDIAATVEAIHFDFNIYDLATLAELDTEGLDPERAGVNITLKSVSEISGHNATEVQMPELTDENSVDMYGEGYYEPEEDYGDYEEYIEPFIIETVYSDQVPYVDDGEVFMPVYDLFGTMYDGVFTITADSLRYTATGENDYGIGEVFVKVGENSVMVDDRYITFEKPVVNEFNIFRVPIEFVEKLGLEVMGISIYGSDTYYNLFIENPNYVE